MEFLVSGEIRADKAVSNALQIGRAEAARIIKNGYVFCGEKTLEKVSQILRENDLLIVKIPEEKKDENQRKNSPVNFDIEILYEDDEILVLNKPAGLVIHEAPSHKEITLCDWLKAKNFSLSNISGEFRQGIVHRLDKETTGAICVAKTDFAHRSLAKQLETREMGRYYLAIIDRELKDDLIVEKPIARHPKDRIKMSASHGGKPAKSAFIKLANLSAKEELIAAKLFSGRTHQIRAHLSAINAHILGDILYGYKPKKDETELQIFLHAHRLYLKLPQNHKILIVTAPIPPHFQSKIIAAIGAEKLAEITSESFIANRFAALLV
ncbi:MAG: RluA family pseudouridine synthase [Helicobacteraceae bacterium]|jgi:23S rRNA pseudouridine1911/1915/1917 synthase|nr:RluA family pseudouridine synthase [Helicobacteraceae bacterium]